MSEIKNDYKMKKHLLQVLDQLDKKDAISNREKAIGVEDIRARTITKELLAAKRHVDLILENISEGVLELNHEGKIIYVNRAATILAGSVEEELLSKDFTELFGKRDNQKAKKLLTSVQKHFDPIYEKSPVKLKKKQILLNILPVKDKDHQSIIVILKAVTERK